MEESFEAAVPSRQILWIGPSRIWKRLQPSLQTSGLHVRPIPSLTSVRSCVPSGALVVIESATAEEVQEAVSLADHSLISIPLLQITVVPTPEGPRDPRLLYLPPSVFASPAGVHILQSWATWAVCPASTLPSFLCDHLPVALARLGLDGRIMAANLALRQLLGEHVSSCLADCLHPADRDRARDAWQRIEEGEPLVHFLARCRHHDGSWRTLSWSATRAPGDNMMLMVGRDVTAAFAADERIRQLEAAIEAAANGILITDADGRIQWVNAAFSAMTGYSREEVMGQYPRLLKSGHHDVAFYEQMWTTILHGQVWRGTLVNRRKDGSLYTERMTITPLRRADGSIARFIAIKEDVTEAESLREQLSQAARIESLSRLAGGVAHDFNNLLQTILGYLELVTERCPENDPRRADLETIRSAARQAADLTRRLLAFSRRQIIEPRPTDLNELLHGLVDLIRRVIGEQIHVELHLDPMLAQVMVDPGQIETVVMNLVANARDAMPHGGRLIISTRAVTFQEQDVAIFADARPGAFACLSISDTGPGIPEEVRRHMFEPFFSAKGGGRGTGLGLATVYGIVRQHGGWMHVYSEPAQGACFRIYLPRAITERVAITPPPKPTPAPRHILVVEDEVNIARLAARVLASAGYRVSVAHTATAARALFATHRDTIDLIFCDVMLPDGNGVDLVEELRRTRPSIAILLVSGYPDDYSRWETIHERGWPFIQKPYPSSELLAQVASLFSAAEATPTSTSNPG